MGIATSQEAKRDERRGGDCSIEDEKGKKCGERVVLSMILKMGQVPDKVGNLYLHLRLLLPSPLRSQGSF